MTTENNPQQIGLSLTSWPSCLRRERRVISGRSPAKAGHYVIFGKSPAKAGPYVCPIFDGPSSIHDVPKRSLNIAKRDAKNVSSIFMKISPPSVSSV
jgi:hypothetical protein